MRKAPLKTDRGGFGFDKWNTKAAEALAGLSESLLEKILREGMELADKSEFYIWLDPTKDGQARFRVEFPFGCEMDGIDNPAWTFQLSRIVDDFITNFQDGNFDYPEAERVRDELRRCADKIQLQIDDARKEDMENPVILPSS
jgi:hypothetical protein